MEDINDSAVPMNEKQAGHIAEAVELMIALGSRLQIEGYLENDIDKSNTSNALITLLVRLNLVPDKDEYAGIVDEIWDWYKMPKSQRRAMTDYFNEQLTEYNNSILEYNMEIYQSMQDRGMIDDDGYYRSSGNE